MADGPSEVAPKPSEARTEQMGSFLVQLASSVSGAVAGVTGTAAAGPIVGAAAATATAKITSSVLATFLGVQDTQLRSLETMNSELSGRLAQIEADLFMIEGEVQRMQVGLRVQQAGLRVQLEEPWTTALAYLQHAAEPQQRDSTREEYVRLARDKLFTAHSIAESDTRRALVAQRLAAVSIMLADIPSARMWLVGAYPMMVRLVSAAAGELEQSIVVHWTLSELARVMERVDPDAAGKDLDLINIRNKSAQARPEPATAVRSGFRSGFRRRLLGESASDFWISYIRATPDDREAIRRGTDVSDGTLAQLRRVRALRALRGMEDDLINVRTACLQLGGDSSVVPASALVVELFPLTPPQVRII
jgi:hypothetical protein